MSNPPCYDFGKNIIIMNAETTQNVSESSNPIHLVPPDPEPWPEPVNGQELLDALAATFARFVILPPLAGDALALWALHTYAFQLRDVACYLGLESPEKRCGKTTLLGVLCRLVNRPIVAANISPPAFFRVIKEVQPTLLIDEADTFVRGNEKLRGILNSGYSRTTAFVVRAGPQRANGEAANLRTFSCWCPKALAAIGRLPDTLADRCIIIVMQRKRSEEKCDRLRQLDASILRRQCARFILDHRDAIAVAHPRLPEEMHDRAGEIWEPLFALADLAGGYWPERARRAAIDLTERAQETSPIGCLFFSVASVFALQHADQLFTRQLVEGLNQLPHYFWRRTMHGKDMTERMLAQLLRPYGISPSVLVIQDQRARGYKEQDFLDPMRRYISVSQARALAEEILPSRTPSEFQE
jgi:hypothetical protein